MLEGSEVDKICQLLKILLFAPLQMRIDAACVGHHVLISTYFVHTGSKRPMLKS